MAAARAEGGGQAPPCYVFRLIKFDAYGNKVQKRKYGFTAKNNDVTQLDKSVYDGIITRAEQTFNLRTKSSYSLYLVLGGGPYVHELGEPDLRLEDYPDLSSHSWTIMRNYESFYEKRHLMHALTPDGKNRKVINLCLIESTLHDLSMRKQFLKDLAQAKKASKITAAISAASSPREPAAAVPAETMATTPTTPASVQIDNERSTTSVYETATPTGNGEAEPVNRSNALPRRESPYSDVQDFITSFANLLAPPPAAAGSANGSGINLHGNMNLSAAEIIKRAANFVAPPPPLSSSAAATAAATDASNAAASAAKSAVEAANRLATHPTLRGLPYEPFMSRSQRTAHYPRSNTVPPAPAAAPAAVPLPRATPAATPKPPSPATSSRSSVSDNKYASLKAVFDKFVVDFNSDLADAFGGSPLTSREEDAADTRATTPTSSPSVAAFKKETNVLEANGEKESAPQLPSKKSSVTAVAHRATCDNCNKWIFGTRYKCFTCPDWDCCEACLSSSDQHHPGHALAAIHDPKDLIRRRPVSNEGHQATHFGIHCDSCNVPITGIRYKCAHPSCPDFDLCSNCEADPASYANNRKIGDHSYKDHLMVKIRQPVSRFGTNTVGSGRWNLDRAIRSIQNVFMNDQFNQTQSQPSFNGQLSHGPGKNESTWTVDVPMPFAMQGGGDKEVHLSFDVGTNEKGESVIIGLTQDPSTTRPSDDPAEVKPYKEEDVLVPCAYVSPPGCQMPKLPEQEVKVEKSVEDTSTKVDLDARWINDVTFADGTAVAPGTIFNKVWSVENNGRSAWPHGTRLVCVSGFGKDTTTQSWQKEVSYEIETASPDAKTVITAENIVAPEVAGKFMSYYRFITPDGVRFGDRLWIDIVVEDNEGSRSNSSLNSSSIVTPTLKIKGSEDTASTQGNTESVITAVSSALTSPRTTDSGLADDVESLSALSHASDEEDDCDFVLLSDEEDYAEV